MARRFAEPIVKRHEGQWLAQLTLQIEAAGELHGVACPQAMAEQECPRLGRNLGSELDNDQGCKIVYQRRQGPVPFLDGKRPFSRPTNQGRGDLDFREAAHCGRIRLEQAADGHGARFAHVPLHQRARVKVARQKRSSRSSTIASDSARPRLWIGRKATIDLRTGRVTARLLESFSRAAGTLVSRGSGRSSAIGSPRSVTRTVRPSRTRRRYVPSRVFSSRAPTTLRSM